MTERGGSMKHRAWLFAWLPGLVALQSIPGTGALRTLFLLLGIVHVGLAFRGARPRFFQLPFPPEGVWLVLLTGWLLLQSTFLSPAPASALATLCSEWGKLALMLGVGIAVVAAFRRLSTSSIMATLFAAFFAHVASTLTLQVWNLARGGGLIFGESLLGNYGYVSPFTTTAFALLLADAVSRFRHGVRLLSFSRAAWMATMLATLAAEAVLHSKAGQVMSALLLLACLPALAGSARFPRRWAVLVGVTVIALGIAAAMTSGHRWNEMREEVATAMAASPKDVVESLVGASEPDASASHLKNGSFYLRLTWARLGLAGIAQHPLGLGYGADAFGRYVTERYGVSGAVSSHSGWIDFALANGLPGLALLLILALVMMHRGWRRFQEGSPAGLALALITFHYIVRSAIDGNLAGSRLTGFAFVAGLLWHLAMQDRRASDAG